MPIDTSMYGNIKPFQVDSPLNALAQVAQVQNAQNQNKLAELTYGEKQRVIGQESLMNEQYKNALDPDGTLNRNKLFSGFANAGLGSKLPDLQKKFVDTDKAGADLKKTQGEISAQDFKLSEDRRRVATQNLAKLALDPDLTLEKVKASMDQGIADGHVDAKAAMAKFQGLPQDPVQLRAQLQRDLLSILSPEQQHQAMTPKAEYKDTGGQIVAIQNNPNLPDYGKPIQGASLKKTQSPDSVASNATSRANNQANISKDFAINGINPDGTPGGDVETMAQGIASGKLAPIGGFALAKPRGQAIMARVMEVNPNYDAGDYTAKNAALKGFSTGKEGTALRSFNVATDHLDTLGQMADALHNGNAQILNKIGNEWNKQTGNPAPTNFDAVKEIVGKEVVKAIVAGGGGVSEREELSNLMSKANSPKQLKGVISHFKELMDAQRTGLLDQYQRTTGRTDGAEAFAPSKRSKPAAAGIISVTTAEDYAKVPSGATYTTPDGSTRRKL